MWVVLDYSDVVVHILQPRRGSTTTSSACYADCPELDWRSEEPVVLPETAASQG